MDTETLTTLSVHSKWSSSVPGSSSQAPRSCPAPPASCSTNILPVPSLPGSCMTRSPTRVELTFLSRRLQLSFLPTRWPSRCMQALASPGKSSLCETTSATTRLIEKVATRLVQDVGRPPYTRADQVGCLPGDLQSCQYLTRPRRQRHRPSLV